MFNAKSLKYAQELNSGSDMMKDDVIDDGQSGPPVKICADGCVV